MEILKAMVGLTVNVLMANENISGELKQVDSKGILIREDEDFITYVAHNQYQQIYAKRSEQTGIGIMKAFRKETSHHDLFL